MISSIQKKAILTSIIIASFVILVVTASETQVIAEENDDTPYTFTNDVEILVVFTGQKGTLETDGFQIFKQISGYDKNNETPTFKLEGAVNGKHPMLYEAADWTYEKQGVTGNSGYDQFDVDVILHKDGYAFRQFSYTFCSLDYYAVDTLFDKEEGWNTSKGFTILDEFTFSCNGYKPGNPTFELQKANGYSLGSVSTTDLETDLPTWEDYTEFKSAPFRN